MRRYVIGILLAAVLASCSSEQNDPPIPVDSCYDFVTLAAMSSSEAVFSLQRSQDSPLIKYSAAVNLSRDTMLQIGDRLIIAYKRKDGGEPYTTGKISLYGYRYLDNTGKGVVELTADSIGRIKDDFVDMQALTRTGCYINMQLQLSCTQAKKPAHLYLAADLESLSSAAPELTLVYVSADSGENTYTGYASFDISEVWNRPDCQSVTIRYKQAGGERKKTFAKQ